MDGEKDCFLVQFEPEYYFYGFIYRNNYYRPLNHSRPGINEFDEQNIEKENRYISVNYANAYPIIASIIDEQMTSTTEDNYYATDIFLLKKSVMIGQNLIVAIRGYCFTVIGS